MSNTIFKPVRLEPSALAQAEKQRQNEALRLTKKATAASAAAKTQGRPKKGKKNISVKASAAGKGNKKANNKNQAAATSTTNNRLLNSTTLSEDEDDQMLIVQQQHQQHVTDDVHDMDIEEDEIDDSGAVLKSSSLSSSASFSQCQILNPMDRELMLTSEHLYRDETRVLTEMGGLFYAGVMKPLQPPDVYAITLDGERGNKSHIMSREEIFEDTVSSKL